MALSRELLKILACPETKAPLVLSQDGTKLVSTDEKSRRCYCIENDIPNLLISESTVLEPEEYQQMMANAIRPEKKKAKT